VDLAQTTRRGTLIDTLRDRLILPIRDHDGDLTGFVGRDTAGNPRAPKYRNPTHTPTFEKATAVYTPRSGPWARTTVVVEGPLDALAIAASSAMANRPGAITAVSALGTAATAAQVDHVATHAPGHIVIALDGDTAGVEGTKRWVDAVCRSHRRPALVTQLPDGLDPADWLALHGPEGLAAFDPEARRTGLGVWPGPAYPWRATAVRRPDATVVPLPARDRTPTLR
jgi:DNA primase